MDRHGSESYFIVGEGLVAESGGGRDHPGFAVAGEAAAPPFRFSRMGPKGTAVGDAIRGKVAVAMTAGGGGESNVPFSGSSWLPEMPGHRVLRHRSPGRPQVPCSAVRATAALAHATAAPTVGKRWFEPAEEKRPARWAMSNVGA